MKSKATESPSFVEGHPLGSTVPWVHTFATLNGEARRLCNAWDGAAPTRLRRRRGSTTAHQGKLLPLQKHVPEETCLNERQLIAVRRDVQQITSRAVGQPDFVPRARSSTARCCKPIQRSQLRFEVKYIVVFAKLTSCTRLMRFG